MKASEWAAGRWPEIIGKLIGDRYVDGKHHPCPSGIGKDCFRFSNINGKGNFFCRCSDGTNDGFDLIKCQHGVDFAGAIKLVEQVIGERPRETKQSRQPTYAERLRGQVEKTPRSRYLESRGLIVPPSLDWHPSVDYREEEQLIGRYPAMLAPITRDGRFLSYHVTYLNQGRKADVPEPRKILPKTESLSGGAVELFPAETEVGIAEGIETAIAAQMLFDIPVWAALNTSLLKAWKPPERIKHVRIFGDYDKNYAGQAAAYALANRLYGQFDVEIHLPESPGDFNDELTKHYQNCQAVC